MKKVSIQIPCYNEVGNVQEMAETVTKIMSSLPYDYEIFFVDNASTDGTKEILRAIAASDNRIKVLINNRNYGLDGRSRRNAEKYLSGDVVINLPCDFQEPPELIPEFLRYWEEGYLVVCGQKIASEEGKLKYALRDAFYRIINSMSETPQYAHISGITLLDRQVLDEYLKSDYDFHFRYALADMGYETKIIPYKQQQRKSGKSSYNFWRYLSFAVSSLTATSYVPLRVMTVVGFIMSVISFVIGVVYLVYKLIFWDRFQAGTAPMILGMFFLGSIQLLFIGILGEYIGAILKKVTKKPDVIMSETINL